MSIEGISVEHIFEKQKFQIIICNCSVFNSCMSDYSSQFGATAAAHIKKLLYCLCYNTCINTTVITIWEETYDWSEHYISATSLYLLSILNFDFQIVIDQGIGTPGHVKNVIDGLNSLDKKFLMSIIIKLYVSEDATKDNILPHPPQKTNGFVSLSGVFIC